MKVAGEQRAVCWSDSLSVDPDSLVCNAIGDAALGRIALVPLRHGLPELFVGQPLA